jgi:hypothetical protein
MLSVLLCTVSIVLGMEPASGPRSLIVTADQRVTITGSHCSLESLLEDLSWRAGFELRSFGIDDRAIAVRIDNMPLGEALRRLVGRDHYTAGVAVSGAGARVTWVEVPGPRERAGTRRHRPNSRSPGEPQFQVPPKLFLAAFESVDPAERAAAASMIERRVIGDPAERARFLATDVDSFVDALAKYPQAAATLRAHAERQPDIELRRKLGQIVLAIEQRIVSGPPAATQASRSPLAHFFE